MKVVIQSNYVIRGESYSSYYSFRKFSKDIELVASRELALLERIGEPYSLSLTIEKDK